MQSNAIMCSHPNLRSDLGSTGTFGLFLGSILGSAVIWRLNDDREAGAES